MSDVQCIKFPDFDKVLIQVDTHVALCIICNEDSKQRFELRTFLNCYQVNNLNIHTLKRKVIISLYHIILHLNTDAAEMVLWFQDIRILKFLDKMSCQIVTRYNIGYDTRTKITNIFRKR